MEKSPWVVYWLFDEKCTNPHQHGLIGATGRLWQRMFQHRENKSGRLPENFRVEILLRATKSECLAYEAELRPQPGIGWNVGIGGFANGRGLRGIAKTEEHRAKQRAAALARYADPTERARTAEAVRKAFEGGDFRRKSKGHSQTEATKQKIRDRIIERGGIKNPVPKGSHRTDTEKAAISIGVKAAGPLKAHQRRRQIANTPRGEAHHAFGKPMKITNPQLGKDQDGTKNPFFGRKHSEETRQKLRKAALARAERRRQASPLL